MKTIAVYGSLKKGRYNHSFLSEMKMIGTTTVKGTLYRVSSYPALVDEGENEYDAEVYEVDDYIYERIKRMEIGAGYKETLVRCNILESLDVVDAIVYYADERLAEYCKKNLEIIESY